MMPLELLADADPLRLAAVLDAEMQSDCISRPMLPVASEEFAEQKPMSNHGDLWTRTPLKTPFRMLRRTRSA